MKVSTPVRARELGSMKEVVGAISILSYHQFIVNAAILHFHSVLLFCLMWVGMRGFRNSHQGMAGRGWGV